MIAVVVVVGDEGRHSHLQVGRHLIGDLLDVPFDSLVVVFELAIGLRVKECGQNVLDSPQEQVVSEATGHISRAVVREQPGPVGHRT